MQRSQVDLGRPRGPVLSAVLCLETQRGLSPLHLLSEDRGGGHTPPGVTPLLGAGLPDCPPLHPHPNVACTPHLSSDLPPDSSGTWAPAWTRCQSPGPSPRCARDSGSYSHSAQDSLHPSARLWTKAAAPAFFSWEARGGTRPGSVPALGPLYWAFLPRPSDGAVWLGWRSRAHWRLRAQRQSQEAGTPQEHVATACLSPKGQGRVTQGQASPNCPKPEASHTWACLGGGGLT